MIASLKRRFPLKRTIVLAVILIGLVGGLAAYFLADWDPEGTRREAFVYWCNEEGGGGTFTSREYCEELYVHTKGDRNAVILR